MQLYLPIAEISVNLFGLIAMGGIVGFLSGLFGVGGGFLLTPLLIFFGVAPPVAVASVTGQIVAASTSGVFAYAKRKAIDTKLAIFLIASGIIGSAIGVWLFGVLRTLGQLDLVISIAYFIFLTSIGILMLTEALKMVQRQYESDYRPTRFPGQHIWIHGLPLRTRFPQSKIYISILPVLAIGLTIGFLGAMLGIGGGFIMVPALIYLLRVPGHVVIGTSLLQVLAVMAVATFLHAISSQTVDIILALSLMVGSVVGAQLGANLSQGLKPEILRLLFGLLVLVIGLNFAFSIFVEPQDLFSLATIKGSAS